MRYRVKAGDTLSQIATAHGLRLSTLLAANPSYATHPDRVHVGEELDIPGPDRQLWTLGSLSAKYETGGRGPGTISTGIGDAGGVSYGSYQMTSKNGGTVGRFVTQPDFPWQRTFHNLTPGSPAFTAKWQQIAATHPEAFHKAQHAYIKQTHFDPLVERLRHDWYLDVTLRSRALQDVIWSTAVQHGPNTQVVHRALDALAQNHTLDMTAPDFDQWLICRLYAERGRKNALGTLVYFVRCSLEVQRGVARRFVEEEQEALQMLRQEEHIHEPEKGV